MYQTKTSKLMAALLCIVMLAALLPAGIFAAGDGVITITDEAGLIAVANDLSGSYQLGADIELKGSWKPLGSEEQPFVGTFDGNYHKITNLRIQTNVAENNHGLFGYIGVAGTVKNTVVKVMDNSYVKGGNNVGAIAGYNAGIIDQCGLEASAVSDTFTVSGSENVGGIAGYNAGSISGCFNRAEIYSSGDYAGGITGYTINGSVLESYNTGEITAGNKAGGITGYMKDSTIRNCMNTGALKINGYAAKGHMSGTGKTGVLENCYYPADTGWDYTTGGSRIGVCSNEGYVGDLQMWISGTDTFEMNGDIPWLKWENPNNHGSIESSDGFVESIVLDNREATLEIGETLQVTAEVLPEDAADKSIVWSSDRNEVATVTQDGKIEALAEGTAVITASAVFGEAEDTCTIIVRDMGTEPEMLDGIYQICSTAELKWFALHPEKTASANAVLVSDIVLADTSFLPMFPEGYAGTFSGGEQRHTITYQWNTNKNICGLFAAITEEGVVKNLKLSGEAVVGHSYFGSVAGYNKGRIEFIDSIVSTIPKSGKRTTYIGGLAGKNSGLIQDSVNLGTVRATDFVGGIAGENVGGSIWRCENKANITAENVSGTAGGIVGAVTANTKEDKMTLWSCINGGTVQGGTNTLSAAGGMVGKENVSGNLAGYEQMPELIIRSCSNKGILNAGGTTSDDIAKTSGNCTITFDDTEDQTAVEQAKEGLDLSVVLIKENPQVTKSISLPDTFGDTGVKITWESSNMTILQPQGVYPYASVILPEDGIETVTLTANIQKGRRSAEKEFKITVWSLKAIQEEQDQQDSVYLEGAVQALNNAGLNTLIPVSGVDTNLNTYVERKLSALGYDRVKVSIQDVTNPEEQCAEISEDGEIRYFWADPAGFRGMWFAKIPVTFSLAAGEASANFGAAAVIYWDKAKVERYLEEEILSEIQLSGEVESDLELPKYIGGQNGKTWVEIQWKTSDSRVIAISEENQWDSADARYNPYVGKVLRGEADQAVTLTATAVFNRTNNANGGTEQEILLTKEYPVVVKKMDDAALAVLKEEMQDALENGYDVQKLTDYVTGEQLDLTAVKNDIQLLIPKETGIDHYFDYRFTVTSSNHSVIETSEIANAARAFVYRPLPGEEDSTVTLTIFMTSIKNPNLTVSKSFDVTVKALTEEEIQDAAALMNAAKAAYFYGINNGANADKYHITQSLSSFREVVWDSEHAGVKFIYDNKDAKRDGIIPDELPNWAEQEDWRTFRSSNPKVVENETLNYIKQPQKDTFIQVNSVLTHEIFGKYAEKFVGNPAYDVFRQFYQQPVEEMLQVVGKTTETQNYDTLDEEERDKIYLTLAENAQKDLEKDILVTFRLEGEDGMMIETTVQNVKTGVTVFEVFRNALREAGYTYTAEGSYIQSITDDKGNTLGEFSKGPNSGWMYKVNGSYPEIYMNACYLEDGDEVVVLYTTKRYSTGGSNVGNKNTGKQPEPSATAEVKPNPTQEPEKSNPYSDIQAGSWYYDAVQYVTDSGLFMGTDMTHFSPELIMNRGMLVTVLYRLAGKPEVSGSVPFVDVLTGEYYYNAVLWANQEGIVLGKVENIFAPEENITREQMAAVLWRYAKKSGIDVSQQAELAAYTDAKSISAYAEEPMRWAVAAGLIQGTSSTTIEPASGAERAQVAEILMRYEKNVLHNS